MPRQKQWPPRPHHHKPSGQERVRVGGRDHYLGPIGSAEARRRYAELVAGLPKAPPKTHWEAGPTVAEAVALWRRWAEGRYAGGRELAQYDATLRPVLDLFGPDPASAFGCRQLEEARDEMAKRGWNRAVVNRRVIRVRTVWRWLERRGHAPAGTWAGLRALEPLTAGDRHVKAAPPPQVAEWPAVAACCRMAPRTVRDMLLVQWFTGMRSGEVRTMRAGEVDAVAHVYRPATHKNAWRGQVRAVALGPVAWRVLAPRLAGLVPGDFVFPSGPGRCYRDDSYARAVARAALRAGVMLNPYACRHAFKRRVTRALGLDAARAALGQASILTTDRYAAGTDDALAAEAARKCG